MQLPQITLDANTTHLIVMSFLTYVGYEMRQWRIWFQNTHGGAPDAPK